MTGARNTGPEHRARRCRRRLCGGLLVLGLAACGPTRLALIEPVPRPVMRPLALDVGLLLPQALTRVEAERKLPSGEVWQVELGPANAALFRRTLSGIFRSVTPVDARRAPGQDAVVRPTLSRFQLRAPEDTHTGYFEAWIVYRIELFSADSGGRLAQLSVRAYGRSPDRLLADDEAMRQAITAAFRDAAAALVLSLRDHPSLQALRPSSGSGEMQSRGAS